jgi:hypothetical protein
MLSALPKDSDTVGKIADITANVRKKARNTVLVEMEPV